MFLLNYLHLFFMPYDPKNKYFDIIKFLFIRILISISNNALNIPQDLLVFSFYKKIIKYNCASI
jgi:hypothetical protein